MNIKKLLYLKKTSMKILYDHQIFQMQKFGGISRYFHELFTQFSNNTELEFELSLLYSDNVYMKDFVKLLEKKSNQNFYNSLFWGADFKGKYRFYKMFFEKKHRLPNYNQLNKEHTIKKIIEGDYDIFHATYYDDYFLKYIGDKPFVITVHDLIHQIFPEYFLGENIDKNINLLQRASKIITISNNTKKDLMDFYNISEEKISVIYHASSLVQKENLSEHFQKSIPQNYILYVGTRALYKNFYFLVEAFSKIKNLYPNLKLVCTGNAFSEVENVFFEKLKIKDSIIQYFVNDDQLIYLYQNAKCFIFPSLYEGFGIPILEAFENKCCTLLSNTSCMKEIAKDAAIYFNPKDINSLTENLIKILSDSNLRTELIAKGLQRVNDFSWEMSALNTFQVYKSII